MSDQYLTLLPFGVRLLPVRQRALAWLRMDDRRWTSFRGRMIRQVLFSRQSRWKKAHGTFTVGGWGWPDHCSRHGWLPRNRSWNQHVASE